MHHYDAARCKNRAVRKTGVGLSAAENFRALNVSGSTRIEMSVALIWPDGEPPMTQCAADLTFPRAVCAWCQVTKSAWSVKG
jgi:hypothetical protein